MTHFIILIIVPYDVYIQGLDSIRSYIDSQMEIYDEGLEVEPYIYKTKEQYCQFKSSGVKGRDQYDTLEKYRIDYCGYDLVDQDGNILSTYNKKCFWDCYEIGGRWNCQFKGIVDSPKPVIEGIQGNGNIVKISDFLKLYQTDKITYSYPQIIDLDGQFHHSLTIGWFVCCEQIIDQKEWETKFEDLLNHETNDYLVVLDCHIKPNNSIMINYFVSS